MSEQQAIDTKIIQLNQRLKTAQLGVQIERRGQKLNLRATFPPRPDSTRLRSHQQRLSLNLPATPAGLKQAEQEAKIIAAQLLQNTFSWRNHLIVNGDRLHQMDLPAKLQAFEQHYFAQSTFAQSTSAQSTTRPASARTTWETAYAPYLRKLSAIAQSRPALSLPEAIYAAVQSTQPNSRSRQICCTALNALAEFLALELPADLKQYAGNYSPNRTQARSLPTDEEIVRAIDLIPNPAWRFVYGIMAAYGLRNHEVFFCDYGNLQQGKNSIEVLDTTKTGGHEVWPFDPEWVEQFDLRNVQLPAVNTDLNHTTLQRVGQQVSTQFRRYDLPFAPYNLRHAWAVRTIHFGLPDAVAARMMGHSIAIHTQTYQRWLSRRDQQQAVEAVLRRRRAIEQ